MLSPYDAIVSIMKDNLSRSFDHSKNNFASLDKFITWVVGFATATIALIISNFQNLNSLFHYWLLKTILFLLCIAIAAGIAFRYFLYLYQRENQNIELYLLGAFSNSDIMGVDVDSLETENDINKIINALKIDFGFDYSNILTNFSNLSETQQTKIIGDLKAHHMSAAKYAKDSLLLGLDYVKGTYSKAYGIPMNKIERIFDNNDKKKLHNYRFWANFTFWIMTGCFLLVLILFCVFY